MSDFKPVNQTITPISADQGEEFPFLHTITVVDRVVSVDKPELVQNNIKTETVTLNLDSEWDGLSCIINIGNGDTPTSLIWSGQPVTIPAELMTDIGTLNVSVVGYRDDGALRAVTKKADAMFTVVASGYVEGDEPVPDPTTILGQLTEAADRANQAADRFNQASEDIGDISDAVIEVKGYADAAKDSETTAASSAATAYRSETNAASSVSAAKVSEANAAASATAARNAVDGFGLTVGSVTTVDPGTDAAVDITKDGTRYTADFTIPRGDKGEPAVIEHNETLVGDGTTGSPLSIADGTLLSAIEVHGSFDFNDKKASGVYIVNSSDAANSPRRGANAAYGALFVAPTGVNHGVIQLFFSVESTEIKAYLRLLRNEWMPWKSIPMSTNVSELESRIAALNAKSNELAGMETRVQALEARIKSLETN